MNDGSPTCEHEMTELRRRVNKAGGVTIIEQCLRCGGYVSAVKKTSVRHWWTLNKWDQALVDAWNCKLREYWAEKSKAFEEERERENEDWWRRYHEHINSEKWGQIRLRRLKKANFVCEGCGVRVASQVHHLTYKRLGDEMLFDLVAVCEACHEKIHGRPIGDCMA
jgi:5-methylcytosine-specific restriction endonuclease McrA